MVKISKEDAYIDRKVLMRWIDELTLQSLDQTIDRDKAVDELHQINDYICNMLGLDPNDIPFWGDD